MQLAPAVQAACLVKVLPLPVPQPVPCASSGRASQLWAARHSQSEAPPLGAKPLPRVLKRAASKVANFTAFDQVQASLHCAGGHLDRQPQRHLGGGSAAAWGWEW